MAERRVYRIPRATKIDARVIAEANAANCQEIEHRDDVQRPEVYIEFIEIRPEPVEELADRIATLETKVTEIDERTRTSTGTTTGVR